MREAAARGVRRRAADGRFQVIVLADVIEHLEDPLGALDACERLLAPGGALCVITPDPSSPTARLAGRALVGLHPGAHLPVPAPTLRELLESRGLVISEDVPLVRSFALGYWLGGLAERGGALGRLARRAARPGCPATARCRCRSATSA